MNFGEGLNSKNLRSSFDLIIQVVSFETEISYNWFWEILFNFSLFLSALRQFVLIDAFFRSENWISNFEIVVGIRNNQSVIRGWRRFFRNFFQLINQIFTQRFLRLIKNFEIFQLAWWCSQYLHRFASKYGWIGRLMNKILFFWFIDFLNVNQRRLNMRLSCFIHNFWSENHIFRLFGFL